MRGRARQQSRATPLRRQARIIEAWTQKNRIEMDYSANQRPRKVKTNFLNTKLTTPSQLLVRAPVPVQEPRDGIRVGGRVRSGQRTVALGVRPALRAREERRQIVAVSDDGVLSTCTD